MPEHEDTPGNIPGVAESSGRLVRAGWTVDDMHLKGDPHWVIHGRNEATMLYASGKARELAWQGAVARARSMRMLGVATYPQGGIECGRKPPP